MNNVPCVSPPNIVNIEVEAELKSSQLSIFHNLQSLCPPLFRLKESVLIRNNPKPIPQITLADGRQSVYNLERSVARGGV